MTTMTDLRCMVGLAWLFEDSLTLREHESQALIRLLCIPSVLILQVQAPSQLCILLESGVIQLLRKQTRNELLPFNRLIAKYLAPSKSFVKLGKGGRKIPIKDLTHHPQR